MKRSGCVDHLGEVIYSSGSTVRVRMLVQSACAGCSAKRACGTSESEMRELEVHVTPNTYQVGDQVSVSIKTQHGFLAVFIGYLMPLLLVLATLIVLIRVGVDEGLSALTALSTLIPYYVVLRLLRSRIAKRFEVSITAKA